MSLLLRHTKVYLGELPDMRKHNGTIVFSPSDLILFLASPFASWMERYHLENPGALPPDEETEDQKLIIETGNKHELTVLTELREVEPGHVGSKVEPSRNWLRNY